MEEDKAKMKQRLLSDSEDIEMTEGIPKNNVVLIPTPQKMKSDSSSIETPKSNAKAPISEGESYTISDTPDLFVCSIFDSFKRSEARNKSIGRFYILFSAIAFTVLSWMKSYFLSELPSIEVIFVVFLITFVLNYYLINGALLKPFLEKEDDSWLIKVNAGYAVGIIACFYYSLNFLSIKTAASIFYFGLIVTILIEIYVMNEAYTRSQLGLISGAFVAAIVSIITQSFGYWSDEANTEGSGFWGVILALAAAGMFAVMLINFGKMYNENFASMNHIFSLIIVLFLPVFFPIEGVVRPSVTQWILMVLMGFLNTGAVLMLIRGIQLENPGFVSVIMMIHPSLGVCLNFITGQASGLFSFVVGLAGLLAVVLFARETRRKIDVRETFIGREGKWGMEEMKEFTGESIH